MEEIVKGDAAFDDVMRFLIGDASTLIGDEFFVNSLFSCLKLSIIRCPSSIQIF